MPAPRDLDGLRTQLGITASDAPRLEEALRHGSVNQTGGARVKSNVTLAFVGDAVIELAIRHSRFKDDADATLGELSMGADEDVTDERLAERARTIHLGDYIDLGKGAETERKADSVLATAFEAVIGAIFIEKGFNVASGCFLRIPK